MHFYITHSHSLTHSLTHGLRRTYIQRYMYDVNNMYVLHKHTTKRVSWNAPSPYVNDIALIPKDPINKPTARIPNLVLQAAKRSKSPVSFATTFSRHGCLQDRHRSTTAARKDTQSPEPSSRACAVSGSVTSTPHRCAQRKRPRLVTMTLIRNPFLNPAPPHPPLWPPCPAPPAPPTLWSFWLRDSKRREL